MKKGTLKIKKELSIHSFDRPHTYVYCLRCGRKLLSDEAKAKGYGKICEQKMAKESDLKLF